MTNYVIKPTSRNPSGYPRECQVLRNKLVIAQHLSFKTALAVLMFEGQATDQLVIRGNFAQAMSLKEVWRLYGVTYNLAIPQ